MKHRSDSKAVDPVQIGAIVREQIESAGWRPCVSGQFPGRMAKLAELIALWGSKTNLTARPEDPLETAFHIFDSVMSLVIARSHKPFLLEGAFSAGQRVLDLGSGAGFPGLVLAAASDAHFTLIESRRRRTSFLAVTCAEMGLLNVDVITGRIEDAHLSADYDLVVTRALGAPTMFTSTALAGLHPGGFAVQYASEAQLAGLLARGLPGFAPASHLGYTVRRRDRSMNRALVFWRKLQR
ncbi:MAG TPA: RsmG family class I SAM-dependent methyltransferase [Candidatus Binataceae bacterium]